MQVAIIDDLAVCRQEIKEYLLRYIRENYQGEEPELDEFESGTRFLDAFRPQVYDVIFIDQYMEGMSGMDTAREIRRVDEEAALIFVTTSCDHAVDSYGVRACGYLIKPFTYEAFGETMRLARLEKIMNARFIALGDDRILLKEILWCDRYDQCTVCIFTVTRLITHSIDCQHSLFRGCVNHITARTHAE